MCGTRNARRTCRCITELLSSCGRRRGPAARVVVGELTEQIAQLALTARCGDGQMDLLEVDHQTEQAEVQRADNQVEHLARLLSLRCCGLREHRRVEAQRVHAVALD